MWVTEINSGSELTQSEKDHHRLRRSVKLRARCQLHGGGDLHEFAPPFRATLDMTDPFGFASARPRLSRRRRTAVAVLVIEHSLARGIVSFALFRTLEAMT